MQTSRYLDCLMTSTTPLSSPPLHQALRVLADETRLRILALLAEVELSVGEIARCLAMGQSRVSNHLRVLRENGLIGERHEGSFTFCRLDVPEGAFGDMWGALAPSLAAIDQAAADRRRLATVLADRSENRSFFDKIAGDWDLIGADFTRGTGRLEMLSCLVPNTLKIADVGCGTGYLAAALGRRVGHVICVDASEPMLARARENLHASSATMEFRIGVLEQLPLEDDEVDAACAHMVMHHLVDPRLGFAEMARVVRPGGLVVCIDMLPHHEVWMRDAMADTRLGIEPTSLVDDMERAGLTNVRHEMLSENYIVETPSGRTIELPLHLVHGRVPDADRHDDESTAS